MIVHRLNNVGGAPCTEVPYFLGNVFAVRAQFLKPLDTQTGAQFVWELMWRCHTREDEGAARAHDGLRDPGPRDG